MMPGWWTIQDIEPHVHRLVMDVGNPIQKRRILHMADCHWDSKKCDRALLASHLDKAKAEGAPVLIYGDFFDVMGGKYDPRSSKSELREELLVGNYLDEVVKQAADWLKPWAENIALISLGNHETSITKRHEINLLDRLVYAIKSANPKCETQLGKYWGFVNLVFHQQRNQKRSVSRTLHFSHGYGGGGPVSRGLIDHSRTRSQYFAHYYLSGHVHWKNTDQNVIAHLSRYGKLQRSQQHFIRCGPYKDEYDGWHAEQGRSFRPLGGWFTEHELSRTKGNMEYLSRVVEP